MRRSKKTEFNITDDAVSAFRRMVRHRLEVWDACSDLERILKCEVDSNGIDDLASGFDEPDTTNTLTADDLREWLEDYAGEPTEEDSDAVS